MRTLGLPISHKENENRRVIVPKDLSRLSSPGNVFIEAGYGRVLGIDDAEYKAVGCMICPRNEVLQKDIICDPKVGDAEYLDVLQPGQTIFGWVHATQNPDITDKILEGRLTAYGWESMFEKGRHVFWFNNEIAGEAAVINAFQCYGKMPNGLDIAVIGNGNTARGALRVLHMLGANVMQYTRKMEPLFRDEMYRYDVIVNCILWDVSRRDHILYKSDLKKLKKGAMIIDVSCDRAGGIETCIPTTIEMPTYIVDGVLHYAVDHTPSLFYKTFSFKNSEIIAPYLEELMRENPGEVLRNSLLIADGVIIDQEINKFQGRN